jgi:hypothetical protein
MDREDLQRLLQIHHSNLTQIEEQIARYGMTPPLHLLNERDFIREQIVELESLAQEWPTNQPSDPHLDAHWKEVQRLVRARRWWDTIQALNYLRETAPAYRPREVETLLEKARQQRMKKRR